MSRDDYIDGPDGEKISNPYEFPGWASSSYPGASPPANSDAENKPPVGPVEAAHGNYFGGGGGGTQPGTPNPNGNFNAQGIDPESIFKGADGHYNAIKRTYTVDPTTGKTLYGYETLDLGDGTDLGAMSTATGINTGALQAKIQSADVQYGQTQAQSVKLGQYTVYGINTDASGNPVWRVQLGSGALNDVPESALASLGIPQSDIAQAKAQFLNSQRTINQAGQWSYGGIDPRTGTVTLRDGGGNLKQTTVQDAMGGGYAGLDQSEVQRAVQQANSGNFQAGAFSLPGTPGYQPGMYLGANGPQPGANGPIPPGANGPLPPDPRASAAPLPGAMGAPNASPTGYQAGMYAGGSSLTQPQQGQQAQTQGVTTAGGGPSKAFGVSSQPMGGAQTQSGMPDGRGGGAVSSGFGTSGGNQWAGMTNQQAQQTADQAQTGKTLTLLGKYGNLSAGANGSYSGTDFYGNTQNLTKDQLINSGSATADQLYNQQAKYADDMRQTGQMLRAQQSRYLAGYDPNQVRSSVAGM